MDSPQLDRGIWSVGVQQTFHNSNKRIDEKGGGVG